ncbi:MAG: glycosyltransferase, partial [Clostridia bacterium]|nr:glycosyltransferase [Clostridia bacterium]
MVITVLLAVFNGEKYLAEQIDSILNQTISDIKIVIRDDGSSDSSPEIIK